MEKQEKTKEVDVKFKRKLIDAFEIGAAKIVVPESATDEDIEKILISGKEMKIFIIKDRTIGDYDWEWSRA